jgi:hypothetical protein
MAEGESRSRVVILAGPYRIKGEIELMAGARMTDYMLDSKAFLAVTHAEVWDLEGRKIFAARFLNVSRSQIVVIAPE